MLVLGVLAARRTLPEWEPLPRPAKKEISAVRQAVEKAGGRLSGTRLRLAQSPRYPRLYERAFRILGAGARSYLNENAGASAWILMGRLEILNGGSGRVAVVFDKNGEILDFEWHADGELLNISEPPEGIRISRMAFTSKMVSLLARGQKLAGQPRIDDLGKNTIVRVTPLEETAGQPPESIVQTLAGSAVISVSRELSDPGGSLLVSPRLLGRMLLFVLLVSVLVIAVLIHLGVLLFKRRLSFRFGLGLGVAALLSALISGAVFDTASKAGGWLGVLYVLGGLANASFLVVFWAVAESLLRDSVPGFSTSLDSLLSGRLGPRSGRALVGGIGLGAAAMGSRLALHAFAGALPATGVQPELMSFHLPFFGFLSNPFVEGTYLAGMFVMAAAWIRRVLPKEKADPLAAALTAAFNALAFPLTPFGASLILFLVEAIFFLWAFRKFGLTALIVAAVSGPLLRDLLASGQYFAHLPFIPILSGAVLAALLGVGLAACMREEKVDSKKPEGPEYVRRIEKERRLKYEMDLLARMQVALLPEIPPAVKGFDLSARTVIATEAGGDLYDFILDDAGQLWVAAGDVAGHGYSCGIQQAMVKASLLSLVKPSATPAQILGEIHRVLRSAGKTRLFTSLVLLRIDTRTGRGLAANAGHPFPLKVIEGRCEEITLPGLPLGQGPARVYNDAQFELEEGASLVLASDGLFEAVNREEEQYGYERARSVLAATGLWRRPAEGLLEALLADWRWHIGEGDPADDTTIVAVKRTSLSW